jgi:hypothetical protein
MEPSIGARREGRQGRHIMLVQQAGHAAVAALVLRMVPVQGLLEGHIGVLLPPLLFPEPLPLPLTLPLPLPLPLSPLLGLGAGGKGPLEDFTVLAEVGVVAAVVVEGALLVWAQSRTRRPVPRPPSCPAQSPRV